MEHPIVELQPFTYQFDDSDSDATFKREVAFYTATDPMPTLKAMSERMQIPVGALARYVLAKWATSGSEGIMEIGPRVIHQMAEIVREGEAQDSQEARDQAYEKIKSIILWLSNSL